MIDEGLGEGVGLRAFRNAIYLLIYFSTVQLIEAYKIKFIIKRLNESRIL